MKVTSMPYDVADVKIEGVLEELLREAVNQSCGVKVCPLVEKINYFLFQFKERKSAEVSQGLRQGKV